MSFETAIYTQRLLQVCKFEGCWSFMHDTTFRIWQACEETRRLEETLVFVFNIKVALKKVNTIWQLWYVFFCLMRRQQKRDWFSTRFRQIFGTRYSPKNRWTMRLLMAELWKISVVCTSRLGWRKNFPPSRHPTDLSTLFLLASYRGHLRVERRKERTSCPSHASDKTSCGRKWRTSKSLFQHSLRSGYSVGRRFHHLLFEFFLPSCGHFDIFFSFSLRSIEHLSRWVTGRLWYADLQRVPAQQVFFKHFIGLLWDAPVSLFRAVGECS